MRPQRAITALLCATVAGTLPAPRRAAAEAPVGARQAVDAASVAIFAFRDARGRPMAWPVTPYRDGDTVVVTSTLAFMRKTIDVRRDGRVALLAHGVHFTGRARVHADVSGAEFVRRFLDQELAKYPPTRDIVAVPFHRTLFSWFFGRVFMELTPLTVRNVAGDDHTTLVTLDADGVPVITPIAAPQHTDSTFTPQILDPTAAPPRDGPALVLQHLEPSMSDLRQLLLRGDLHAGSFSVRARHGSLAPPAPTSWWGELRKHLDYHRRGREARAIVKDWDTDGTSSNVYDSGRDAAAEKRGSQRGTSAQ